VTGAFLIAASISALELLELIPIGGLWKPLGFKYTDPFLSLFEAGLYLTASLSDSIIHPGRQTSTPSKAAEPSPF